MVGLSYEVEVPQPMWAQHADVDAGPGFHDVDGAFAWEAETLVTTVVITKVEVYESKTNTHGASGVQLFTLNVTDSMLDYTVS